MGLGAGHVQGADHEFKRAFQAVDHQHLADGIAPVGRNGNRVPRPYFRQQRFQIRFDLHQLIERRIPHCIPIGRRRLDGGILFEQERNAFRHGVHLDKFELRRSHLRAVKVCQYPVVVSRVGFDGIKHHAITIKDHCPNHECFLHISDITGSWPLSIP